MRDALFEGGKKNGVSLSDHQFLNYCELDDTQCAMIVHMPELRRFSAEAKESRGKLAWTTTREALRGQGITNAQLRLAVGLRGIALYDRVLLGNLGDVETARAAARETTTGAGSEQRLLSYFRHAEYHRPPELGSAIATNAPGQ